MGKHLTKEIQSLEKNENKMSLNGDYEAVTNERESLYRASGIADVPTEWYTACGFL